ncbi:DEAD/DEAH box helicase family protein [Ponticoccus gilvus]|nr:DEAD/DEAH box helicase family protein [Enemella evansiae]
MADLFSQQFDFNVPERIALEGRLGTAFFRKTASPTHLISLILTQFSQRGVQGVKGEASDGRRFVFVDQKTTATFDADEVFLIERTSTVDDCIESLSNGTVTRLFPKTIHPARCEASLISDMAAKVREAWGGSFILKQEEITNGEVTTTGLRPPQVGAIHAALAHWSVSNNPATIVMPTGTGKTETMLALATAVGSVAQIGV